MKDKRTLGQPIAVERVPTAVMFIETADDPAAMAIAWDRLETVLPTLRGRRFLGTFDLNGRYRVSVQMRDEDDPNALMLDTGVVPGGTYLRVRLRGDPPELYACIPPALESLRIVAARDAGRPFIESYRRRDEVDVLMPVASESSSG